MLDYFVYGYVWFWFPRQLGQVQLQALAVTAIPGPPLSHLAVTQVLRLRLRSRAPAAARLAPAAMGEETMIR